VVESVLLSAEERACVDAVLARLSQASKYPLSLEGLVSQWSRFVTSVEQGYSGSLYDYTNDIAARDVLKEILLEVFPSTREKLSSFVKPLDVRFDEATREVKRMLLPSVRREASPWWRRVPKILSDELKTDLLTEGILE